MSEWVQPGGVISELVKNVPSELFSSTRFMYELHNYVCTGGSLPVGQMLV